MQESGMLPCFTPTVRTPLPRPSRFMVRSQRLTRLDPLPAGRDIPQPTWFPFLWRRTAPLRTPSPLSARDAAMG
jgi:hypothetical protein